MWYSWQLVEQDGRLKCVCCYRTFWICSQSTLQWSYTKEDFQRKNNALGANYKLGEELCFWWIDSSFCSEGSCFEFGSSPEWGLFVYAERYPRRHDYCFHKTGLLIAKMMPPRVDCRGEPQVVSSHLNYMPHIALCIFKTGSHKLLSFCRTNRLLANTTRFFLWNFNKNFNN